MKSTKPLVTIRYIQPTFVAVRDRTRTAQASTASGRSAAAVTKATMISAEAQKTTPTSPSTR